MFVPSFHCTYASRPGQTSLKYRDRGQGTESEQKDKDFDRLHRWSNCALTQEPLRRPIVACQLGRMYNKQTILEFLLESKSGNLNEDDLKFNPDIVRHIKGIKV